MQTTRLSNRELRSQRAKELRSDAINRFMADCQDQADYAKGQILIFKGTFALIALAALSNAMGWN